MFIKAVVACILILFFLQGLLMGVFDGHGGPACAQVISKRLFNYIAANLLPADILKKCANEDTCEPLIETFNDKVNCNV